MKAIPIKLIQWAVLAIIVVVTILAVGIITGESKAHSFPEYATRTNEDCSACHVNPGGGGPRTLTGLLWTAKGRPDAVPRLENLLIAPGVDDGVELYDIACEACHGASGEGLFGLALTSSGFPDDKIRSAILRGRERSGMPSFAEQFTDQQLDNLVEYVTGISSGEIEPAPLSYPLDQGQLSCTSQLFSEPCGGN
jgi:mono/diheme cytochrome c family protein